VNFSRFRAATRILAVNCAAMAGNRLRQPLCKFSALNVHFSNPSSDPLASRMPAHAGVKEGYPSKNGYLSAVGLSSVKMAGMWSRSIRLGLETFSRRTNVSSRLGQDPQRLGLVSVSEHYVSSHCVSSRRFVHARAMHTVAAVRAILSSMTFVA